VRKPRDGFAVDPCDARATANVHCRGVERVSPNRDERRSLRVRRGRELTVLAEVGRRARWAALREAGHRQPRREQQPGCRANESGSAG